MWFPPCPTLIYFLKKFYNYVIMKLKYYILMCLIVGQFNSIRIELFNFNKNYTF